VYHGVYGLNGWTPLKYRLDLVILGMIIIQSLLPSPWYFLLSMVARQTFGHPHGLTDCDLRACTMLEKMSFLSLPHHLEKTTNISGTMHYLL
jgi:hypothetical protein